LIQKIYDLMKNVVGIAAPMSNISSKSHQNTLVGNQVLELT